MWYGFLDGKPAFWTFAKSQKILNLRRDPKITALVEDGDTYDQLRGVELVGTGRIIEDVPTILEIGKSVGSRYTGPAALTPEALPFLEAQATKRLGVVIDVERVVSWDHRKLGAVDGVTRAAQGWLGCWFSSMRLPDGSRRKAWRPAPGR